MDWIAILGCILGSTAFTTIINAIINRRERNSKTDGIDISNLSAMINTLSDRMTKIEEKADADRKEAHRYVKELRDEIIGLRGKVNTLERSVTQAYRCKLPKSVYDCPVVREYESKFVECSTCIHNEQKDEN